jgi:uncharacterized membrane protein
MAFCKSCGQDIGSAAFCPKCGASQSTSAAPAAPAASAGASSSGLEENVAGLLCYLFGWISGLIFFLIDKRPFVKFHAAQSIAYNLVIFACYMAIWVVEIIILKIPGIGLLGFLLFPLLGLAVFATWIFLMYKAYSREKFKLPIIGNLVEGMVK